MSTPYYWVVFTEAERPWSAGTGLTRAVRPQAVEVSVGDSCAAVAWLAARRPVWVRGPALRCVVGDLGVGEAGVALAGAGWRRVATAAFGDHGVAPINDPDRLEGVPAAGLDQTAWPRADVHQPTTFVTTAVDVGYRHLLDVTPG